MNGLSRFLVATFLSTAGLIAISAALVVGLYLSLAPRSASAAGNTYSEATYITRSQFMHEVKEVSLTLASDPWIAKYVSESDQRDYVITALSKYNIAVRPNAPVSLLVTLENRPATIRRTTTYTNSPDTYEDYRTHLFYYSMAFFVRATALRNGKFHVLRASPAFSPGAFLVEENNEVRRLIYGDELGSDIRKQLAVVFSQALDALVSSTAVDTVPWAANGWTEKQKSEANAAYAAIMNTTSGFEKRPIDGLDIAPQLELSPDMEGDACVADPSWRNLWQAEFQRFGWVKTQREPAVELYHDFWCASQGKYSFPSYFSMMDDIELVESNLVFELNGRLVRKPGVIFASHRTMLAIGDEMPGVMQSYVPRSITEFATGLTLGNNGAVPKPPDKAPESIPRAS